MPEISNDEKLRLLFIEQEDFEHSQGANISQGAATVFSRWPSYITSAIWCTMFIISFVTLLTLLVFMALVNKGKLVEQNVFIPRDAHFGASQDIQSEFCNQMIGKHHKKVQEIPERDLKIFDSGNNIFYIVVKPIDKFSACSVESVIKHSPDKNVFVMFLKQFKTTEFETALKSKYSNFNVLNLDGKKILRGSPFELKWKGDERSILEVSILTVWQFGGIVLSDKLLMMDRKIFDTDSITCKVDSELIFCPVQCASYVYDLIGAALKSPRTTAMDALLDESIKSFCGSEHFINSGCTGVTRIDETDMCNEMSDHCMFVRINKWQTHTDNASIWESIHNYCPVTGGHQALLTSTKKKGTTKPRVTSIKSATKNRNPPHIIKKMINKKPTPTETVTTVTEQFNEIQTIDTAISFFMLKE